MNAPHRTEELLRVENISKSFGGVTALRQVCFDLHPGEIHALVGENGAGKSTLTKILSGIYVPDQGDIWIGGEHVSLLNPAHAIQLGIYQVYQETNLVPQLSVAENIFLGRYQRHPRLPFLVDMARHEQLASEILDRFDLPIGPKQRVVQLSAVERQVVSIARALARKCQILILDEPTANLSQIETEQLFNILKNLRNEGVGIIYISHRLEELQHIGDRVTVLRDGKRVRTSAMVEVDLNDLVSMMIGRRLDRKFPQFDVTVGRRLLRIDRLTCLSVFKDVSFTLREGEILGVGGQIDSGYLECVHSLFGLHPYDSGTVEILGRKQNIGKPRDAMRAGIALLPGDRKREGIVPTFSVRHNITVSVLDSLRGFLGALNLKRENRIAEDYKNRFRIKVWGLDQKVVSLSGGNQQKVVLSKTLCSEPKIIILVEPTRGIDVGTKYEIYVLLVELARQGHGIILVSSELPELLAMCHRILVFRKGVLRGEFGREQASQDKILLASFGKGQSC